MGKESSARLTKLSLPHFLVLPDQFYLSPQVPV